ncbi:hypothetical protein Gpo141_00014826, partial [Globisporangium polare]
GYGEARHFGKGSATIQRVSITGSGKVSSKEITSESATVRVIGSGEAILDVKESLEGSCQGWGVVRYVDAPPKTVTTRSLSLEKARAAERKVTAEDRRKSAESSPVPARKDAFEDDVVVDFDPKTAREKRSESFDVFAAIEALKGVFSRGKRVELSIRDTSDSDAEEE